MAAAPLPGRAPLVTRWSAMARTGLRMMFHNKLKMAGVLFGVVFSVVLTNQAAGTFLGLLTKSTMYVDHAGADLFIVPPGTQQLVGGQQISEAALTEARAEPGVGWAEPLLWGNAMVKLPSGASEPIVVIGVRAQTLHGGPWSVVAGDARTLADTDTMIFEDSQREKLGGLNLGSVREVNGYKTRVGGFTWGLLPFGPSLAFADYDYARSLLHVDRDRMNYVLVGCRPDADVETIRRDLERVLHGTAEVLTAAQVKARTIHDVLVQTSIGVSIGAIAAIGLIVGFVIVALTMFSSVIDNLREFGTLKAIGTTNLDLAKLLFVQSVTYAVLGTVLGVAAVRFAAHGMRSAKMAMVLPPFLHLAALGVMLVVCVAASSLALLRLRKLEPAMVFR